MKHTPGPWLIHKPRHCDGDLWIQVLKGAWDITSNGASEKGVIADAKYSAMTDEENEANARLIAAAPDLLEALQRTLSWLTSYPGGGTLEPNGVYEQARRAISMAIGSSKKD